MKISKVNHMRTAVRVADITPEGILYVDPSEKPDPVQNIEKVYNAVNNRAARLYCMLNPSRGEEGKEVKNVRKVINSLIMQLLSISVDNDMPATVKKQLDFLASDKIFAYVPEKVYATDEQIDVLVTQYLRKSLRTNVTINAERYYLPDIITKLIIKLEDCWKKQENVVFADDADPLGVDEVKAFLAAVVNDWYKLYKSSKKKEDTIRSIENQKALIKVISKNGHSLLVPSNSAHAKKVHVFAFMRAYVAGSEDDRRSMLIAMRTLLTIYLRGEGDFNSVTVAENSFLSELSTEDFLSADISTSFDEISRMKSRKKDICEQMHSFGRKLNDTEKDKLLGLKAEKNSIDKNINRINVDIDLDIENTLKAHYKSTLAAVSKNDFLIDEVCKGYCSDVLNGEEPKITALQFWLDYFDGEARKILLRGRRLDTYKTGLLWLGKRIWSSWTSYIAQKFIDYGKTVYHFAMPEDFIVSNEGLCLGDVLPEYQDGISSFEYERLKARDDLDRSIAVAVTFAANTFSRAILESTPMKLNKRTNQEEPVEDILFADKDVYSPNLYEDAGKRILRYFGGASSWENNDEIALYAAEDRGIELIVPIQDQLKDLRNSSFHYLAAKSHTDTTVIRMLFDQEKNTYSQLVRKKYYSNNVYRYYSEEDIKRLLDFLYRKPVYVPAQIPAFKNLFNRTSTYIHNRIVKGKSKNRIAGSGTDEITIFKGTLFFLLKEIYYNAFLQDPASKDRFVALVRGEDSNIEVKNEPALADFRKRIKSLGEDATLGEICQLIMTDYELQNQDKRVRKSRKNDREIYKHFRCLLYLYLKEAFIDYLLKSGKSEIFGFIREPVINKNWAEKSLKGYLVTWTCDTYKDVLSDESVLKWYTLAHFLTPKQLNHLIGSYKHYEVFINDIERRANNTRNRVVIQKVNDESRRVRAIVNMLAFSASFCARTTNKVSDYFKDDEAYASVISEFVLLDKKYVDSNMAALKIFSDKELNIEKKGPNGKKTRVKQKIGIYYDALNPIVNRNVVLASMYGDLRMLSDICDRVTEKDAHIYYSRKEELADVFKTGVCSDYKEQEKLREFQNMKNRIELHDLLTYTEMISDLNGQLVNWSYFRERDLMYMQLGVQYTKLFLTSAVPEDDFRRKISGDGFAIKDGAVLYQIVAMYDYSLPLYGFDRHGRGKIAVNAGITTSGCIGGFVKGYCGETFQNPVTYNEGLYFFENIGEHDELVDTRNYIDHFKYYANHERSLLDLYSEIYERFFDYSRNFKKSVSYILPNICERYFVVLDTEMDKDERLGRNGKESRYHTVAGIRVKNISSANFTYKLKVGNKEEKYQIPVHSEEFLTTVKNLLEYKV